MILLLVGRALAACDPSAVLVELEASGTREAYLCVAGAETGKDLLLAVIADDPAEEHPRATRAIVLWLLERSDRAMDPAVIARLTPADRRLLADGIRARRGRISPSPEHAAVFQQLAWYAPVDRYTDGRLRPVDRANLDLVDPVVRPAPPPVEPVAAPVAVTPRAVGTPARWGCASVGGPGGALGVGAGVLAALFGVARRRGDSHPGAR